MSVLSKTAGVLTGGATTYATDKKFRGGLNNFIFGESPSIDKLSNLNPQQEQFQGNMLQQLLQMMQPGGGYHAAQQHDVGLLQGGQQGFENFSQPYMNQFNEQVLPGIAERFAGGGALSSSGFGQALGGAASGMQSSLAQLFQQLQGQAAGRQQGQFNTQSALAMQPSFSHYENPGHEGFGPQFIASLLKAYTGGGA